MVQARIRHRTKSSMQSGRATADGWLLEYEPTEAKRADPLTGWAGSGDVRDQVRLSFPTLDAAKDYCARNSLDFYVTGTADPRPLKLQAYADNFKGSDVTL